MENKKFCPLPWIFQAVRNNGDIRVCCQANPSMSKGIYRKDDGTAYNASVDDLTASRNSELAKAVRLSMLNEETHEACIRCDREDDSNIQSRRQYETALWQDRFNLEDAVRLTASDGAIDTEQVPVMYYDLRFGNFCNLKCRMCGPTDSHSWYEDHVKVWNQESFKDSHGTVELIKKSKNRWEAKFNDYDWVNSENFWEQIDRNIPNIQHIHTVGGEPLLIDQHYDLLQRCIDQGYAKNIVVEYNTNLTNIPKRAWDIWPHFKRIQIGASIDAVGPLNDYIRNPSRFSKIAENLHKIDKAPGDFRIWIACTVQIYNAGYIPDFIKWILEQRFERIGVNLSKPILNPHPLHNPKHLNTKALPPAAKQWVRQQYDDFYPWLEDFLAKENMPDDHKDAYRNRATNILESYYDMMMKDDWSDELDKFWYYSNTLDEVRNEKLSDVAPELYQLLKTHMEK